jgi:magnesium transporter
VHERLARNESVAQREEYQDLYDDLIIENKQAIETCNIYKNILSVTMDAYGSVISNNANDTMRKLTIITIILAIPTMIAGFWGMNTTVPFQSTGAGTSTLWFWLIVVGTIIITVALAILISRFSMFTTTTKPKKKKKDKKRK